MTLEQFQNWALSQGSVAKTDGGYLGECVSLINQYLSKVYGLNAGAWGHAKDWATNSNVLQHFDRVGDLQRGDIVVYGPNFGGGYGHIGIYLGNGQLLDQNGRIARRVSVGSIYPGYIAILRRKGQTNQGVEMASNSKVDDTTVQLTYNLGLDRAASSNEIHSRIAAGDTEEQLLRDVLGSGEHKALQQKWYDYDRLSKQVAELSSRPTKAELQALADELAKSNAKVAELENPDNIVVSRGFFNGLFDKIKNIIGGK